MSFFSVENLSKRFSGLVALDGVSFEVREREIVGLIGPNGAGKSTCFNVVTGTLPSTSGRVHFRSHDITRARPHEIAKLGLVRSFQQTAVFQQLSVRENLRTACYLRSRAGVMDALLRSRRHAQDETAIDAEVERLLALAGLAASADLPAASLPYGHLRKLGVGIGLAAQPALLMLDEPASGLNSTESAELVQLIRTLREQGLTVLIVEHDMKVIMGLCDRIVVLSYGRKLAEGDPVAIRANPEVVASYLGTRHRADP